MYINEIAQKAKIGELFKNGEDEAQLYFNEHRELMAVDDMYHVDMWYPLSQKEMLSDKWHFI